MTDISGWRKRQIALDQIKDRIELETRPLINFTKQKEWVGLTDEEIQECLKGLPTQTIDVYARRIEAKLRSKNT
jgi:hypothetical protein